MKWAAVEAFWFDSVNAVQTFYEPSIRAWEQAVFGIPWYGPKKVKAEDDLVLPAPEVIHFSPESALKGKASSERAKQKIVLERV